MPDLRGEKAFIEGGGVSRLHQGFPPCCHLGAGLSQAFPPLPQGKVTWRIPFYGKAHTPPESPLSSRLLLLSSRSLKWLRGLLRGLPLCFPAPLTRMLACSAAASGAPRVPVTKPSSGGVAVLFSSPFVLSPTPPPESVFPLSLRCPSAPPVLFCSHSPRPGLSQGL